MALVPGWRETMARTNSADFENAIAALYDASDAVRVIADNVKKMKADGVADPLSAISTLSAVAADCAVATGAIIMAARMAAQDQELEALKARFSHKGR